MESTFEEIDLIKMDKNDGSCFKEIIAEVGFTSCTLLDYL